MCVCVSMCVNVASTLFGRLVLYKSSLLLLVNYILITTVHVHIFLLQKPALFEDSDLDEGNDFYLRPQFHGKKGQKVQFVGISTHTHTCSHPHNYLHM